MVRLYVISLLFVGTLLAPAAQAQEEKVRTVSFEGPEFFCHILYSLGMKPIDKIERGKLVPAETVIIVLGEPRILREIDRTVGGLARYLKQGGSLLIATDTSGNIPGLPIAIDEHAVTQPKEHAYRGEPQCPWLRIPNHDAMMPGEPGHPLFQFLRQGIATNGPTHLRFVPNNLLADLLTFPTDALCHFPALDIEKTAPARLPLRYMAGSPADTPPHGRVMIIAGHGMFMNGMMLQPTTDNFEFTVNAVKWLREKKQGKRTQTLFVVDGKIITDFDANLAPPPLPVPPGLRQKINQLLRDWEDERFFHQFPPMLAEKIGTERGGALCLGFLTFLLLLYGIKKFMESRHQQDTTVPLAVGAQAAAGSTLSLSRQRQHELIRRDNYWEVARAILHEWLREQFGPLPTIGVAVELQIQGAGNPSLQRQVDYVMALLRAAEPIKVTERDFVSLAQGLSLLNQALKDNQLALLVAGKRVRQLQAPG